MKINVKHLCISVDSGKSVISLKHKSKESSRLHLQEGDTFEVNRCIEISFIDLVLALIFKKTFDATDGVKKD